MKRINVYFVSLLMVLLAFGMVACSLGTSEGLPAITENPQNQVVLLPFGQESITVNLTVKASGGKLKYQWYSYTATAQYNAKEGTEIPGGTNATLSLSLAKENKGQNRYYVMVSNPKNPVGVQSRGVTITLNIEGDPEFPVITEEPWDTTITKSSTAIGLVPLSVTAEKGDNGVLTYQWYQNDTDSNEGGTLIEGATRSSYTPPLTVSTENGTFYYYVVITNTLLDYGTTSVTTSDPVAYTLRDEPSGQDNTVTVDITQKFQYVRGFGGSSIIWENFPNDNVEQMELMHGNGPDQLGLNVLRIMIPPDYTNIDYTMEKLLNDSIQDQEGNWRYSGTWWYDNRGESPPKAIPIPFNEDGRRGKSNADYYDIVAEVNKHGGYVLASPWSPPGDWKNNGHFNDLATGDAYLLDQHYGDFANYLKRFCEIMYENGAPVYTVSLQNEHTYSTRGGYEGCQYNATRHTNFFIQNGHFTSRDIDAPYGERKAGTVIPGFGGGKPIPSVRTMSGEAHNDIHGTGDLMCLIEDTPRGDQARQGVDILGRHIYGATGVTRDTFLVRGQFHATDPKEVWQTEWSTGSEPEETVPTWNRVWEMMNAVDYNIRLNNESAFIWFPSVSFHAFLGDAEHGTIYGQILPRGYGMSHYAKYAKETGRVGVTITGTNAAAANPSTFNGMNKGSSQYLGPKIAAFVTLSDAFYEGPVESRHRRYRNVADENVPSAVRIGDLSINDIQAISLVMYTPTNDAGGGGTNMGAVRIQLPAGFVIGRTTAIRSSSGKYHEQESVIISADRNSAWVDLPASNFVSVRFHKAAE